MLEAAAPAVAKAILSRVGKQVTEILIHTRQDREAFRVAVAAALQATELEYGDLLRRYEVSAGFLEHEGADELAKHFLVGGEPDARNLAVAAVRSLSGTTAADDVQRASVPLEAPFQYLLDRLAEELGRHPRFQTRLHEVSTTRRQRATTADEREFLGWVMDTFAHLRIAGVGSNEHIQVRLHDVFAPPQAIRENVPGLRWQSRVEQQRALLEERFRSGQLTAEDFEARLDRLELAERRAAGPPGPVMDTIRHSDRVVLLGDPGSGKTTLLSYLALQHGAALLRGKATRDAELGEFRIPLYVRAGNFARSQQRERGLSAFIPLYLGSTLECPVRRLHEFVDAQLRAGRCLILVDGLDEVSAASLRQDVVASIMHFADVHQPRGNRIVCTSRPSGYAAAPLSSDFAGVRLTDMDDPAIEQFLRRYVLAVESGDGAPAAAAQRHAAGTVAELLDAFDRSPGVRRLAANPLLLVAILLVHRSRGRLPERRIDAYKDVTEALGKTWRSVQGVPAQELPDDRRLTQWLTRLGDWMHAYRPEGSATLRDLVHVLGPLWSALQRKEWDSSVVEYGDVLESDVGQGVLEFVEQVSVHSGLLVERAPRRWGFPHLTFEEFYAGRALAFDGRVTDSARRFRARLHDPRYAEPILLGLGLVARDYPDEIEPLFEGALLARGPDAERLELRPSRAEDLIGLDYLFALRALADEVLPSFEVLDELLNRALDEWLEGRGSARFPTYRLALFGRMKGLASVSAGRRLRDLLVARLRDTRPAPESRGDDFVRLVETLLPSQELADELISFAVVAHDEAALRAIEVLHGSLGHVPEAVLDRALDLLGSDTQRLQFRAVTLLRGQSRYSDAFVPRLVDRLDSQKESVFTGALAALANDGALSEDAIDRVVARLEVASPELTVSTLRVLRAGGELPARMALVAARLLDSPDDHLRFQTVGVLRRSTALPEPVVERLIDALTDPDPDVCGRAEMVLGDLALSEPAYGRLVLLLEREPKTALRAARVLQSEESRQAVVVEALRRVLDRADGATAVAAAELLAEYGLLTDDSTARGKKLSDPANRDAAGPLDEPGPSDDAEEPPTAFVEEAAASAPEFEPWDAWPRHVEPGAPPPATHESVDNAIARLTRADFGPRADVGIRPDVNYDEARRAREDLAFLGRDPGTRDHVIDRLDEIVRSSGAGGIGSHYGVAGAFELLWDICGGERVRMFDLDYY